jgi:DNA-binding IclR family transcriptional regulator
VSAAALDREVALVRRQGWSGAAGEREADLNAVAAPVFGADGRLAAILGLQGPAGRFDGPAQDAAARLLLEHAGQISAAIGHGG